MESFTEETAISHEEEAFYNEIRGLVVVFLFFVILFALAHLTLQYFVTRSDPMLDRCDRVVHRMVLGVCTFTLTISFAGYMLLPFSIIANEVLVNFPSSVYVQWLNSELVQDLALIVNSGTKIVCIIVPFSYFLLIAQGFHGRTSAFGSRLLEAVFSLSLSYILVFGTIWSFCSFISALFSVLFGQAASFFGGALNFSVQATHPVTLLVLAMRTLSWSEFICSFLFQTFIHTLESIQLVATFIGLLMLFFYMPIGLVNLSFRLISIGFQSLPDRRYQSRLEEQLTRLQMEALCIDDDIRTAFLLSKQLPTWSESLALLLPSMQSMCPQKVCISDAVELLDQLHSRLSDVQQEIEQLQTRLAHKFTLRLKETCRPLVPVALLILISCMLRLMESFVFFNILDLVRKLLFGGDNFAGLLTLGLVTVDNYAHSPSSGFTLGHKPVSVFGHVGAILQVCVIQFLLCASLWGFHATPSTRFLRPRRHAMDLYRLLANVFLLLLFTSALPLQTNLLGLTTLTLPSALKASPMHSLRNPFTYPAGSVDQSVILQDTKRTVVCDRDYCQATAQPILEEKKRQQPEVQQSWSLWKAFTCHFSFKAMFYSSSTSSCSSVDLHDLPAPRQPTSTQIAKKSPSQLSSSRSIFAQFIARAFGTDPASLSLTPPPSYGSVFIILLYNLCFLTTSVYVAGLRLNDPILWLVSKVFTSLRCCLHVTLSAVDLHPHETVSRHLPDYRQRVTPRKLLR